jgi:hypothetical protein
MTRARTELAGALVAALSLVIFLAWYGGAREPAGSPYVSGTVLRELPGAAPPADGTVPTVANTAPTAPVTPASELPPAELASDRAFINEAFPALSSWSVEEVKPLLSEDALNASTAEQLEQVMTTLNDRLGTLQYFDSPQPVEGPQALDAQSDLQPYAFTAYFEAGEAEVNLVLEKDQQHSSLYSFDINVQN